MTIIYATELKRLKRQARQNHSITINSLSNLKTTEDAHARGVRELERINREIIHILNSADNDIV